MGSVVGKCAKEKDWEKRKPWIENKPPAYRQKQWTHATSLDMKKRPEPSSCNITICKMPRYNSGKLSYETTWRLRKIMRKYGEKMKNAYLKQSFIRHVMHSFALHTPLVFFYKWMFCVYMKWGWKIHRETMLHNTKDGHVCQRPETKFVKYFCLGYLKPSPQTAVPEAGPEDRMSTFPLFDIGSLCFR